MSDKARRSAWLAGLKAGDRVVLTSHRIEPTMGTVVDVTPSRIIKVKGDKWASVSEPVKFNDDGNDDGVERGWSRRAGSMKLPWTIEEPTPELVAKIEVDDLRQQVRRIGSDPARINAIPACYLRAIIALANADAPPTDRPFKLYVLGDIHRFFGDTVPYDELVSVAAILRPYIDTQPNTAERAPNESDPSGAAEPGSPAPVRG